MGQCFLKARNRTQTTPEYFNLCTHGTFFHPVTQYLPKLSDRMHRLINSPSDNAAAEEGLSSACRRLRRSDGSLDRIWDTGTIPNLSHAAIITHERSSTQ